MPVPLGVFAYRHHWGKRHAQWRLTLNWDVIDQNSHVFAAISEGELQRSAQQRGTIPPYLWTGDARMTIHNVSPNFGRVTVWVNIEWADDLDVFIDYLVVNQGE